MIPVVKSVNRLSVSGLKASKGGSSKLVSSPQKQQQSRSISLTKINENKNSTTKFQSKLEQLSTKTTSILSNFVESSKFSNNMRHLSSIKVTTENFKEEVIQNSSNGPIILLDCNATWCPPCRTLEVHLKKGVDASNGKVKLAALDVDESPEIAAELRVSSIPAVFAFKNGQIIGKFVGDIGHAGVEKFITDVSNKTTTPGATTA